MSRVPRPVATVPAGARWLSIACLLGTLAIPASVAAATPAPAASAADAETSRSWFGALVRPWTGEGILARLYGKLSSLGLGSGTWRERRDLDTGLAAFEAMADARLQEWDARSLRYADPLLGEVRTTLLAVMAVQRGNRDATERLSTELGIARSGGDGGRLLGETLLVLSDGRSEWPRVQLWCEAAITDRKHGIVTPHLVDGDEFLYACARAASFAGDWIASAHAAAAVAAESDFAPFAWYAAGSAAVRGEQLDLAEIAFSEVVRNFEAWTATQRDEQHRGGVVAWQGGRDLVRDWALAALVYVHEQARHPAKARAAFRRIKTTSPVYAQAVAALSDDDATVAFAAAGDKTWAESPEAAITYSQWLARNGHELLAGRILENALRTMRASLDGKAGDSEDGWAKEKLAIEQARVERERAWRRAMAQRARATVGSFFTSPVNQVPAQEVPRAFTGSLRATHDATGTYLQTPSLRQPLRNCLADEGQSPRCMQMAADTFPGASALAAENRRRDLYAAEQMLSHALLAQTEALGRIGDGTARGAR